MKTDSWHILIGMKTTKISTANQQIPHSLHLCLPVHEAHVKMRSKHASLQGSGHHKASTYWRICIWVHYFILQDPNYLFTGFLPYLMIQLN
ncbi:hypothetical protein RchiOBHm_Chr3g0459441 [Rosa chinensis]|uniref:Uncharacterized protein n=1 Tax=Rosa chinensis TaxID=74649 RepID=A0A2P6R837_ROSCH|nr:hypothetical protein RchiOBHm_Chr3g0459441 [Rosa chinensis]